MATIRAFVRTTNPKSIVNIRFVLNVNKSKKLYYSSNLRIIADLFDSKRGQIKPRANYPDKERRIFNSKVDEIGNIILEIWENRQRNVDWTSNWLKKEVERVLNGDSVEKDDFFTTYNRFLAIKQMDGKSIIHYLVLKGILERFEIYKNASGSHFCWSIHIDEMVLSEFQAFIRDEHHIACIYRRLYEGEKGIKPRGHNTIANMMQKLRTFFNWLETTEAIQKSPFKKFAIKPQVYGRPYFLTLEERDAAYRLDLSHRPQLAIQRDIFIFQCLVGCRVSDLMRLSRANINNGAIEYVAKKTSGERPEYARVPLTPKALEILSRYEIYDGTGLFPHISPQKYNDDIKVILRLAGVDRVVTVVNPLTQLEEQRHIYEIASSHLARRTFIGNVYKQVKDPNIIGSMSGHVEGSKAFARYRDIDDDVKRDALKGIE